MWCALTAKNDHILTHITSRERMGNREEERQVEQQKHKGKVGLRAPTLYRWHCTDHSGYIAIVAILNPSVTKYG